MEELFQLKSENLDHLLPRIKENLALPREKSQMSALEQLTILLKSQVHGIRSSVFTKLIKFDIISTLCDVLKTFREPLMTYNTLYSYIVKLTPIRSIYIVNCFVYSYHYSAALECLALASERRKFYESRVAAEAVSSLVRLAHYVGISTDVEQCPSLRKLLGAIRNILFK